MRIIHFFNVAGVASILGKSMDKTYGTETLVTMPKKWEKVGYTTYGEVWDVGNILYGAKFLLRARKYDIIHIHFHDTMVNKVKAIYPDKPVVLHYHGSDIRGQWKNKKSRYERADKILVSTPDLLDGSPDGVEYFPNPVDTDLFFEHNPHPDEWDCDSALHFSYGADDLAKSLARVNELNLDIWERTPKTIIPYKDMPSILNGFSWYIDVKSHNGQLLKASSKIGLEALACGLKVITWNDRTLYGLPPHHRPEFSVKKLHRIYSELMD